MTSFVLVVDTERDRRNTYMRRIEPLLAPVNGLATANCAAAGFAAAWATHPMMPVSYRADSDAAAVVWGHALLGPVPERVTSARLGETWDPRDPKMPTAYDGYYAAVSFREGSGLIVGADLLGLFPIYYACTREVVLVGSSPEMFAFHPLFPAALSRSGLVGILLVQAPVDGKTLLRGVRRLKAGHALRWTASRGPSEVCQYEVPVSSRDSSASFAAHVAELDHALAEAMRRHLPADGPHGLMLSGGRDSRMLGGYLRQLGHRPRAFTIGRPGDYEVRGARSVARALRSERQLVAIDEGRLPAWAALQARWEHLASGVAGIETWQAVEPLRTAVSSVVTGHLVDAIAGGQGLIPTSEPHRIRSFDSFFAAYNVCALSPALLKRLLRPDVFADMVENTLKAIRAGYEGCSPVGFDRGWRYQVLYTDRFRTGAMPWRLSFGGWPVLPILDRAVLDVVGRLPTDSLANRRAQDEILRSRFPDLARLPLVGTNADFVLPLRPSFAERARHNARARVAPLRRLGRRLGLVPERRLSWRMNDFNGPTWQAVRRRAEPNRQRLADLFDMDELATYLPAPGVAAPLADPYWDAYGKRLILGLLLWAETHLP